MILEYHPAGLALECQFIVVDAAPKARIGKPFIDAIRAGEVIDRWMHLDGDVLTICGNNRTVVYRIDFDHYDAATYSYPMEWPD